MHVSLRRIGKFTAVVAVAAMLLSGAARIVVGHFLSSSRGKIMVADRLGSAFGMPVEVSEVDVGNDTSSFRFRVMDPANPRAEVLNVPSASADVSAADFMTGRVAPSALQIKGASLTLRIAHNGQVLTPLPSLPGTYGMFPAVALDNGRVFIHQVGRPSFAVSGVNVKLEPSAGVVAITGNVKDPKWGEWTIRGELRRDTRTGWIELASPNAPLDDALLGTIPFVHADVFDDVKVLGRAAATIRFTFNPDRELQPSVIIRPMWSLLGVPLGPCFRLSPTSDGYRFESTR